MKNWEDRDRGKLTEDKKVNRLGGEMTPSLTNLGVNPVKSNTEGKNRIEEDITVEKP